jgi:hypothetical protein
MPAANTAFTPVGLIGWQCRAELRNDTPLHCQKIEYIYNNPAGVKAGTVSGNTIKT